ncbi:MAG: Spy/CpxP family protein refolding chaperone [Lysobacterales bacterium]|jgi:Spy/CpxP family protein refolding chaperone
MKTLLTTIFAAALLTIAGSAFARGGDFGHGRHHAGGPPGAPALEHFRHALRKLDLSDQQKTDIKAVMEGLRSDMQPLMKNMRANHEQLRTLVTARNFDKDAVASVAKKEGELATQRIILTSEAMSRMLGYLTDDQRAQLEQMHTQRMQRWKDKTPPPDTAG